MNVEKRKVLSNRVALEKEMKIKERQTVQQASRLPSRLVFEIIARDGEEELERPVSALIWSGIAGGIMISFSLIGMAVFRVHLPDEAWRPLIENIGYSFGFLLVILGRLQLFTENTMTTVVPVYSNPSLKNFLGLGRLWGLVFGANTVGAFISALVILNAGIFDNAVNKEIADISLHATHNPPFTAFVRGIPAGILIAAIVWILPTATSAFWVILSFTYLIALCGFTHVVAGSVEVAYLVFAEKTNLADAVFGFILPVLIGNVVGGTAIFSFAIWSQVRAEKIGS